MPKLTEKKQLLILCRQTNNTAEVEERNLAIWLNQRKGLININRIEKKAGTPRAIAQVLANRPNRRLIHHLDKIIPVVRELGYYPHSGYIVKS